MSPDTLQIPIFSRSFGSWRISLERSAFRPEALAAHYDKESASWHQTIGRHRFEQAYQHLIGEALYGLSCVHLPEGLRVLDAGIGTGAMSLAFRTVLNRPFALQGIDISNAMLHQAKARLSHDDIDLSLRRADLSRLPFPDACFDVVLAAHVIEHMPDPTRAFAEIYRVLKPGGVVICSVTRASYVGALVQLIWRTHRVARGTGLAWLDDCGFKACRTIPYQKGTPAARFSLGYVGYKPKT
ncbi:MAG: class I SAM-dependent methyltransferase [Litoreibacter sp.]|nr:class I SAM-dependent methyltransferase [Litoreibacter sp.]